MLIGTLGEELWNFVETMF